MEDVAVPKRCTFSYVGRATDSYSVGPGFVSLKVHQWPIGKVVKTAASHAVNIGSNTVWVTIKKSLTVLGVGGIISMLLESIRILT